MQATARPRFRQDLLAEAIEEGGQKYIDVADPDGNAIFRFFEVEYAIACGMDGQRDVAGIVKWAQDELGLSASTTEIQSVIDTLAGLAFIGDDQLVDQAAAKVATQTPAAQAQPASAGAASVAPANTAAAVQAKPAAKASDDLAAGIVVGKGAPSGGAAAARGLDIELGQSGSSAPAAQAKEASVGDIALGAPGASQSKAPPKIPVEDVALGASGAAAAKKPAAADVSMDLSAEMSIGKGDVKEAVRQSKVMSAVDVPKELLEAEAKPTAKAKQETPPAKGADKKLSKSEEKRAEAKREEAAREEAKKAEPKKEEPKKEAPKAEAKKAEPKKEEPKKEEPKKAEAKKAEAKKPVVEKTPEKQPAPPAPASGVSPALIVTLIVVIVAAGAFLAYKFVFAKQEVPAAAPTAQKPPEPPPPTTATAKIVIDSPPAMEVKAGVAGTLESFEPVGKDVKAGDTIAVLAGAKPLATEIEGLTKQLEELKAPLAAQETVLADEQAKENNAAAATAAQKKLDTLKKPVTDKETQLKAKQEQLDKLAIKSTGDGKLAAVGEVAPKAGDKVAVDQVIAKIEAPQLATAMFKIPAGTKIGADGNLSLKAGDKTVICKVTDAQAESVKVTCPADSGLAADTEATITLPAN